MGYLIGLVAIIVIWLITFTVGKIVNEIDKHIEAKKKRDKAIDEVLLEAQQLNGMIKEVHDEVFANRKDDLDKAITRYRD